MVSCADFCSTVKRYGLNFSVGVPCSILRNVIDFLRLDPDIPYIHATREDEALGIAAGAQLGGKKPLVLMQNSGLGISMETLASLNLIYEIPILLLISWRGYQGKDAPQHLIIGKSTFGLLGEIGVPALLLPEEGYEHVISDAVDILEQRSIPAAIIIRRGVIQ